MLKKFMIVALGFAGPLLGETETSEVVPLTMEQLGDREIELQAVQGGTLNIGVIRRGKVVIHPDHVAYILPQVPGVVMEARKNIGDLVNEGDVLAILQSKDLADIQANYLQALNKEETQSALFERENSLHTKHLNSDEDYLNSLAAKKEAKLNTLILRQKLLALGLTTDEVRELPQQDLSKLGVYALHAPLSGSILERNLSKGQYIENNTTVYTLANLGIVWIEIGIYPKDAASIKQGQKIIILEHPHTKEPIIARMVAISPLIEEDSILSKVIAEVDNSSGDWQPGRFVNAEVVTQTPQVAISIPKTAIQTIEGQEYVFVQTPEGFVKRAIKTGQDDGNNVEIVSGLTVGEMIPTKNTFLFKAEIGKNSIEPED